MWEINWLDGLGTDAHHPQATERVVILPEGLSIRKRQSNGNPTCDNQTPLIQLEYCNFEFIPCMDDEIITLTKRRIKITGKVILPESGVGTQFFVFIQPLSSQ
jgi:hypothetical protein